jgi:hypothetical protein
MFVFLLLSTLCSFNLDLHRMIGEEIGRVVAAMACKCVIGLVGARVHELVLAWAAVSC